MMQETEQNNVQEKTHSNAIKIFTVLKNKYVFKIGRYIKMAIHILPIVLLSQN